LKYGTEAQKQKYLPQMAKGEMITAIGTEFVGGVKALRTTAEDKGDHYIVNGQKTFINFMATWHVAVKQMSIQIRKELLYLLWNHRWRVSVKEFL
jgi:acyl-CoA dehydrogenase